MEKSAIMKIAAVIVAAAVMVMGIVLVVKGISKNGDAYRSILIYELEGTADIEREEIGNLQAVEQLYLESGDLVTVAADSFMRLKLDDDKYIMAEADSSFSIQAVGTKEDSKTTIQLIRGAITNEIQNPLSMDSSYEVTTPNAVMAVRGTVFRVEVYMDADGETYTKLSTFEGQVASTLILPDGTIGGEVIAGEGEEVIIYSNREVTEYLSEPEEIRFEEFPLQTLYLLRDFMDYGTQVEGIRREQLEELIQDREKQVAGEEGTGENGAGIREEGNEKNGDIKETEVKDDKKAQPEGAAKAGNAAQPDDTEGSAMKRERSVPQEESAQDGSRIRGIDRTPTENDADANHAPDGNSGQSGSGASDGDNGQSGNGAAEGDDGQEGDSTQNGDTDEKESEDGEDTESHTVKFLYQGQVFGTQTVTHGMQAALPKLSPSDTGNWDFDFSTEITEDINIEWR